MRLLCLLLCGFVAASLAQDYIEGEYFIGLKDDVLEEDFVQVLKYKYSTSLRKSHNFGGKKLLFVEASAENANLVRLLPEVRYVEQNAMAYATQTCPAPVPAAGCWGLNRIDQTEALNITDPLANDHDYEYDSFDGFGVRAYIADTGIDIDHSDFEGRASWGYAADGITNPTPPDVNGHGTHCAGTIGSFSYGVAKQASLIAVKILNDGGSGPWSAIVDGLNWILDRDINRGGKSVVSMSVGGGGQQTAVEDAINALVEDNVICVVSAGNSNTDACTQTPAFVESAITVGATDVNDVTATFTNYGPCVDIYGPGVNIMSTTPGESTDVYSGTSMSCPHVSGAVARYLSFMKSSTPADMVDAWLKDKSTKDAITFRAGQDPAGMDYLLMLPCPMEG